MGCNCGQAVKREPVKQVNFLKNNTFDEKVNEFTYNGHNITVIFETTNNTSIKQLLKENQNYFLNIDIG